MPRFGRAGPLLFEASPDASIAPLATVRAYERHRPEGTVLYQVVQEHLETVLLEACVRSAHGYGLPAHVERTFRDHIDYGRTELRLLPGALRRLRVRAACRVFV